MVIRNNEKKNRKRKGLQSISKSRWLSYAAAGAATVVAGQQTADAAVIVNSGNLAVVPTTVNDVSLALDLDNDGTIDININHDMDGSYYGNGGGAAGATGGTVLGPSSGYYAARFSNLSSIGPAYANIGADAGWMRDDGGFPNSGWSADPSAGYLGVRFDIGGNTHFGFVEIEIDTTDNVNNLPGNVPTILNYGYESIANAPIGIPEPNTLGLLALGSVGLLACRGLCKKK